MLTPNKREFNVCWETGMLMRFVYFYAGWHAGAISLLTGNIILQN